MMLIPFQSDDVKLCISKMRLTFVRVHIDLPVVNTQSRYVVGNLDRHMCYCL